MRWGNLSPVRDAGNRTTLTVRDGPSILRRANYDVAAGSGRLTARILGWSDSDQVTEGVSLPAWSSLFSPLTKP